MASEDKLDIKRIAPIALIVFVNMMGLTIIIPILPYYALAFNAPPWLIGVLGASYPLMQFIGGPVLGSISDRIGRKPVLAVAQAGTFLSLLLLGFANALWIVFAARILDGITGANIPTAQAAITDVTTPKTRSQGLGLIGAAFGLGFIIGPAISGAALALSGNNYGAPAFVASGFALLSVILTIFMFEETLPPERRGARTAPAQTSTIQRMVQGVSNPVIGALLALMFGQQLVFGAFHNMFAPFTLTRLGLNGFGNTIFFVYMGVLAVIAQGWLIGPLTRRYGEKRLIYGGLGVFAAGLILMSLTPTQAVPWYTREALVDELQQQTQATGQSEFQQTDLLPDEENRGILAMVLLLVATTPITIGSGFLQPSINSLITQRVEPEQIGSALGISAAFLSAASAIGPLIGGVLFDFVTPYAPFVFGGVAALALMLFATQRVKPHKSVPAPVPGD